MKQAYKMKLEDYWKKRGQVNDIRYRYSVGYNDTLNEKTPEKVVKRYKKLKTEMEEMPKPDSQLFFLNTDIYNLWLNRDTDEPITARELYNILEATARYLDR